MLTFAAAPPATQPDLEVGAAAGGGAGAAGVGGAGAAGGGGDAGSCAGFGATGGEGAAAGAGDAATGAGGDGDGMAAGFWLAIKVDNVVCGAGAAEDALAMEPSSTNFKVPLRRPSSQSACGMEWPLNQHSVTVISTFSSITSFLTWLWTCA